MAWYLGSTLRQPLLRWICRAYLPIGIMAIGLTGSRGGMIATIVALLVVPLTMTRLSAGRLVAAIAMLCLSGSLAVAFIPQKVVNRLATTSSDVESGHLGGRLKLWVAGAQAFARRPVLGYGTSGFRTAIRPYLPTEPQVAHNSYLSVLVEQGIVGFLLYAWMIFAVFKAVLQLPKIDKRFALVLLATLAVVMLPLAWEDRKPVWVILAVLLGFAKSRNGSGAAGARAQFYRQRPAQPITASPAALASQRLAVQRQRRQES
jgi:O-antigen ligase